MAVGRWLAHVLTTLAVLIILVSAAPPPPGTAAAPHTAPRRGPVVLVGVPGLRWDEITPQTTPHLWELARRSAIGNLSIRTVTSRTCPVDGWLTVAAGQRAASERQTYSICELPRLPEIDGEGAVIPDYSDHVTYNAASRFGARVGLLGGTVRSYGGTTLAVGPGAALAAAGSDGRVDRYLGGTSGLTRESWDGVTLGVIDLKDLADLYLDPPAPEPVGDELVDGTGTVDGVPRDLQVPLRLPGDTDPFDDEEEVEPEPDLTETSELQERHERLAAIDRDLATIQATLPPDSTLLVAGIPRLRVHAAPRTGGVDRHHHHPAVHPGLPAAAGHGGAGVAADAPARRVRHGSRPAPEIRYRGRSRGIAGSRLLQRAGGHPAPPLRVRRVRPETLRRARPRETAPRPVRDPSGGTRRRCFPGAPTTIVAAITTVVLFADLCTGSHLQMNSPTGYTPIVAGRFYGLGNIAFATFATGVLMTAAGIAHHLLGHGRRTWAVAVSLVLGTAALFAIGWPGLGTDFGGVLALVPGLAVTMLMIAGLRVTVGRIAVIGVAAVATIGLLSFLDYLRPPNERSHFGLFAGQVLDGTAWPVVSRKIDAMLGSLGNWQLTLLAAGALLFLFVVLNNPLNWRVGVLSRVYEYAPTLRAGLTGSLVTGLAGFAFNDSGIAIPALALTVAVPLTLASCVWVLQQTVPLSQPPTVSVCGRTATV